MFCNDPARTVFKINKMRSDATQRRRKRRRRRREVSELKSFGKVRL